MNEGIGTMMCDKEVLDACCGSRMMWFQPDYPGAVFMDNRTADLTLCDGRALRVSPDVLADFRAMPFEDASFNLVVFDPPHCLSGTGFMVQKYGKLDRASWRDDLRRGFSECWRVLAPGGTLVFKWSECHINTSRIADLFPSVPLFGSRHATGGTLFLVFYKPEGLGARP